MFDKKVISLYDGKYACTSLNVMIHQINNRSIMCEDFEVNLRQKSPLSKTRNMSPDSAGGARWLLVLARAEGKHKE